MSDEQIAPTMNQAARRARAAHHLRQAFVLLMQADGHDDAAQAVIEETTEMLVEAIEAPGRRSKPYPMAETRHCIVCGAVFTLTGADQEFYRGRGLALPRRCRPCRKARRWRDDELDAYRQKLEAENPGRPVKVWRADDGSLDAEVD